MNKKVKWAIGITVFIVVFAAAVWVLISSVPYAFSGCGRKKTECKDIKSIKVEILSANGETIYSCGGDYGSVTLKPDTDYTIKVSSAAYHYGNPNGMVDFGYVMLNYGDVGVSFDKETINFTEREQEDEKVDYELQYVLRGSECSDKIIVLDYSAEFKAKYDSYKLTPCSFKISFA